MRPSALEDFRAEAFDLLAFPFLDAGPDLFGGLRVPEKFPILGIDHALVRQVVEIDDVAPVGFAHEHDRHGLDLARLAEGQDLEQFVERAVTAGKRDKRHRPLQKVQLAQREIMEGEAKLGRDIGVRELLARQADVEADRLRPDVERAPVGRFHDARAAAGHDQRLPVALLSVGFGDEPAELARDIVIAAVGQNPLRDREAPFEIGRVSAGGLRGAQGLDPAERLFGLADARTAEHDDGPEHVIGSKQEFGLEIVHLQTQPTHRVAGEEIHVFTRHPIGRGIQDRPDARGRLGIVVEGGWQRRGKRLAPFERIRRMRNRSPWAACHGRTFFKADRKLGAAARRKSTPPGVAPLGRGSSANTGRRRSCRTARRAPWS